MDSYEKDAIRRKHNLEKRQRERAARDAPRQQYLARYAAAETVALATIKANKDYNIIVESIKPIAPLLKWSISSWMS